MSADSVFSQFPTLITERLVLREFRLIDAEALFAIKGNFDVTSRYGQEPHPTLDVSRAWIQARLDSFARRTDIMWCLTLKGEDKLIGAAPLWNLDLDNHCGEIGYELHPAYHKQGIMREAVSAILTFGFTGLGLHRIEAVPFDENGDSKNLLLKLGFSYEGTLRDRVFFRGRYLDQLYFGLLHDDWLKAAKGIGG